MKKEFEDFIKEIDEAITMAKSSNDIHMLVKALELKFSSLLSFSQV